MRILMIGGTGVVGRRVVPLLLQAGHSVSLALRDRSKPAAGDPLVTLVNVNLFDARSVSDAVRGHDVIINLATSIPAGLRAFVPWGWTLNHRIRREGVRNLVAAASGGGVKRFIQESYAPMYESGADRWLSEDAPIRPSPHVRSAVDAERAVLALNGQIVTAVVLRFGLFYGPDSIHTQDTAQFVAKGIAATFGTPDDYISSVSTDDAAAAVVASLTVTAGVYNVTDDRPVRKREYFGGLARALGVSEPRFFPAWSWRLAGSIGDSLHRSHRISNAKLKRATSWSPVYPSVLEAWPDVVTKMRCKRGVAQTAEHG